MHIRFYASGLLVNNQGGCGDRTDYPINLVSRGATDFFYEDYYFGRSQGFGTTQEDNILSQQINPNREGGVRAAVPAQYEAMRSDKFVAAVNLTFDLPIKSFNVPLKPYLDLGYYYTTSAVYKPVVAVFGFSLELGDAVGLYVPLAMTKNLKRASFGQQIGFKVDLHKFNPRSILNSLSF